VLHALLIPTTGLCKDLLETEFKLAFRKKHWQLLSGVGVGLLFSFLGKISHVITCFCDPLFLATLYFLMFISEVLSV